MYIFEWFQVKSCYLDISSYVGYPANISQHLFNSVCKLLHFTHNNKGKQKKFPELFKISPVLEI